MNIESYISSGILELFVAGVLLEDEAKKVAAFIQEHPRLVEEVVAIEEAMMAYAQLNSPDLSPDLKEALFEKLGFAEQVNTGTPILSFTEEESNGKSATVIDTPIPPVVLAKEKEIVTSTKVDKNPPQITSFYKSRLQLWRYIAAAAIFLLVSSLVINLYLFTQWKYTKKDLIIAQKEQSVLTQDFKTIKANFKQSATQIQLLREPTTKVIQLAGLQVAPDAKAVVYWHPSKKIVYLDANSMPKPPKDKQYQLWYIDKDGPKDAGIFDYHTDKDNFYQLKDVGGEAQAFAISLEPLGGQPTPTEVYAVGKL